MTATTHSSTWLIFRIGRVACAVPALAVDSILPLPEHITAVPGADAGSPGLFHHSSGTVAVIDLRHRFGCEAPDLKRGRLLLGHVGSRGYGFWVDGVVGLADADQVKPAPLPPELPHNVFTAALRYHDEIVLCSDLARLLAMRDAGGLRHLVCAAPQEAMAPEAAASPPPTPPRPAVPSMPPETATAPPPVAPTGKRAPSADKPPAPESPPPPGPAAPTPPRPAAPPVPPAPAHPLPPPAPPRRSVPVRPVVATPASPPHRPPIRTAAAAPETPPPAPSRQAPVASPVPTGEAPASWTPSPLPAEPAGPSAPTDSSSGIWLAVLLLAGLAGGGFWLWPEQQTAVQVKSLPAPYTAPMPAPVEAPPPAPPTPMPQATTTPAATPLFQGEGIQVEQNGADITIIIDRARPESETPPAAAEAPPAAVTDAGAVTAPAAETKPEAEPPPSVPEPAPPAPAAPQQMYVHTVVRGDTLWDIAERYLDDPWRYKELAQLSRIRNPDLIYPGNKVRIIIR